MAEDTREIDIDNVPEPTDNDVLALRNFAKSHGYDFATIPGDIDRDEVEEDHWLDENPDWLRAAQTIYMMEKGTDADPALMQSLDQMTDEQRGELSEWGFNHMGWSDDNMGSLAKRLLTIEDATNEQKAAFMYMAETYEQLDISAHETLNAVWRGFVSPENIAIMGTSLGLALFTGGGSVLVGLGTVAARTAASRGALSVAKRYLTSSIAKAAAAATLEGAAAGAVDSHLRQKIKMTTGVVDYDPSKTLEGSAYGAAFGATLGAGFFVGGKLAKKGFTNLVDKFSTKSAASNTAPTGTTNTPDADATATTSANTAATEQSPIHGIPTTDSRVETPQPTRASAATTTRAATDETPTAKIQTDKPASSPVSGGNYGAPAMWSPGRTLLSQHVNGFASPVFMPEGRGGGSPDTPNTPGGNNGDTPSGSADNAGDNAPSDAPNSAGNNTGNNTIDASIIDAIARAQASGSTIRFKVNADGSREVDITPAGSAGNTGSSANAGQPGSQKNAGASQGAQQSSPFQNAYGQQTFNGGNSNGSNNNAGGAAFSGFNGQSGSQQNFGYSWGGAQGGYGQQTVNSGANNGGAGNTPPPNNGGGGGGGSNNGGGNGGAGNTPPPNNGAHNANPATPVNNESNLLPTPKRSWMHKFLHYNPYNFIRRRFPETSNPADYLPNQLSFDRYVLPLINAVDDRLLGRLSDSSTDDLSGPLTDLTTKLHDISERINSGSDSLTPEQAKLESQRILQEFKDNNADALNKFSNSMDGIVDEMKLERDLAELNFKVQEGKVKKKKRGQQASGPSNSEIRDKATQLIEEYENRTGRTFHDKESRIESVVNGSAQQFHLEKIQAEAMLEYSRHLQNSARDILDPDFINNYGSQIDEAINSGDPEAVKTVIQQRTHLLASEAESSVVRHEDRDASQSVVWKATQNRLQDVNRLRISLRNGYFNPHMRTLPVDDTSQMNNIEAIIMDIEDMDPSDVSRKDELLGLIKQGYEVGEEHEIIEALRRLNMRSGRGKQHQLLDAVRGQIRRNPELITGAGEHYLHFLKAAASVTSVPHSPFKWGQRDIWKIYTAWSYKFHHARKFPGPGERLSTPGKVFFGEGLASWAYKSSLAHVIGGKLVKETNEETRETAYKITKGWKEKPEGTSGFAHARKEGIRQIGRSVRNIAMLPIKPGYEASKFLVKSDTIRESLIFMGVSGVALHGIEESLEAMAGEDTWLTDENGDLVIAGFHPDVGSRILNLAVYTVDGVLTPIRINADIVDFAAEQALPQDWEYIRTGVDWAIEIPKALTTDTLDDVAGQNLNPSYWLKRGILGDRGENSFEEALERSIVMASIPLHDQSWVMSFPGIETLTSEQQAELKAKVIALNDKTEELGQATLDELSDEEKTQLLILEQKILDIKKVVLDSNRTFDPSDLTAEELAELRNLSDQIDNVLFTAAGRVDAKYAMLGQEIDTLENEIFTVIDSVADPNASANPDVTITDGEVDPEEETAPNGGRRRTRSRNGSSTDDDGSTGTQKYNKHIEALEKRLKELEKDSTKNQAEIKNLKDMLKGLKAGNKDAAEKAEKYLRALRNQDEELDLRTTREKLGDTVDSYWDAAVPDRLKGNSETASLFNNAASFLGSGISDIFNVTKKFVGNTWNGKYGEGGQLALLFAGALTSVLLGHRFILGPLFKKIPIIGPLLGVGVAVLAILPIMKIGESMMDGGFGQTSDGSNNPRNMPNDPYNLDPFNPGPRQEYTIKMQSGKNPGVPESRFANPDLDAILTNVRKPSVNERGNDDGHVIAGDGSAMPKDIKHNTSATYMSANGHVPTVLKHANENATMALIKNGNVSYATFKPGENNATIHRTLEMDIAS